MKFSVITPITYNIDDPDNKRRPRYEMFLRCINSLKYQTFKDFEWIIADDMCNPPVEEVLAKQNLDFPYKVIRLPVKSGRITGRNRAMEQATGEWICWLDGDDEYASEYLAAFDQASRVYPNYDIFNSNHYTINDVYGCHVREFMNMEVQGDAPFGSGHIGAGSYVFKRSVFEDIGILPEKGLWDLAGWAFENYPEIKPFFEVKDKDGNGTNRFNSLGNPWGEDYLYWYMMTRKHKAKYLNTALYIVHSHWGHHWPDDPVYNPDQGKAPEVNPNNQ